MATQLVITIPNLGSEFDIGTQEANKITLKLDASLVKSATGEIGLSPTAINVVSATAGNIITDDTGAFLDQAGVQAVETVWNGTIPATGFASITAGGVNGHSPVFAFDFTHADFVEGVQDAVGQAILAGAGISYDDVADSISTALGTLTFGDGLTSSGMTAVSVQADPASPSPVNVGVAGVSVTPGVSLAAGNLASLDGTNRVFVDPAQFSVDVCDAFGTSLFKALP